MASANLCTITIERHEITARQFWMYYCLHYRLHYCLHYCMRYCMYYCTKPTVGVGSLPAGDSLMEPNWDS
jgi:hypothetical protein